MILLINGVVQGNPLVHILGEDQHRSLCGRYLAWREVSVESPGRMDDMCARCYGVWMLRQHKRNVVQLRSRR
jgi:hypothetical protein